MPRNRKALFAVGLFLICIAINLFSRNERWVENDFARNFYRNYSWVLRTLFGSFPFSLGDIVYGLFFVFALIKIFRLRNKTSRKKPIHYAYKFFIFCCWLYIIFNLSWGINYNRRDVASQLGLQMQSYSIEELHELNCLLVEKVNAAKTSLVRENAAYPSTGHIFKKASVAYDNLQKKYPFITTQPPSVKPALWGPLISYVGISGYYNPFTGEAQVNTAMPRFLQPFVTCHEIAHQAGYAKEMEANFVGYLAATETNDTLMHYSVYLDLFSYANRNLYRNDSTAAKLYAKDLIAPVKKDIAEWRDFNRRHSSYAEPLFRWLYGVFLKSNRQPQGILAYDEVTGFVIAYYKKYNKI
ncbi:MAG: DUF3810 domain-containing protein [Ferruginibacter sp.]